MNRSRSGLPPLELHSLTMRRPRNRSLRLAAEQQLPRRGGDLGRLASRSGNGVLVRRHYAPTEGQQRQDYLRQG
jgi:hypothetical protein